MPLSSSRYKLLPLRGLKLNLESSIGDILEGEMCYATDEGKYYQKEGGVLVPIGSGSYRFWFKNIIKTTIF